MDNVTHRTTTTSVYRPPTFTVYDNIEILLLSNSREHRKLPEDGTWMPKHVEN
jgi:hypothetical protein